jgi:hypothetical protein
MITVVLILSVRVPGHVTLSETTSSSRAEILIDKPYCPVFSATPAPHLSSDSYAWCFGVAVRSAGRCV